MDTVTECVPWVHSANWSSALDQRLEGLTGIPKESGRYLNRFDWADVRRGAFTRNMTSLHTLGFEFGTFSECVKSNWLPFITQLDAAFEAMVKHILYYGSGSSGSSPADEWMNAAHGVYEEMHYRLMHIDKLLESGRYGWNDVQRLDALFASVVVIKTDVSNPSDSIFYLLNAIRTLGVKRVVELGSSGIPPVLMVDVELEDVDIDLVLSMINGS